VPATKFQIKLFVVSQKVLSFSRGFAPRTHQGLCPQSLQTPPHPPHINPGSATAKDTVGNWSRSMQDIHCH